jgi:hypothetical protein
MNYKNELITLALILGVSVSELNSAHSAFVQDIKQEHARANNK